MLSIMIICQNEESHIEDCLKSIKFADEIVIVDSGSTDTTLDICAKYTDLIYHQEWLGMNKQKAFTLSKTNGDWVLNIDADERVTPELEQEIKGIVADQNNPVDGYYIPRKAYYLGKWLDYGGWTPDYKLRLFKKGRGNWQGIDPHDQVVVDGKTVKLKNPILHYSFCDLSDHLFRINQYTSTAAEELNKKNKKAGFSTITLHWFFAFIKSFFLKKGYKEGTRGLIQAILISTGVALKYAKLWEIQKVKDDTFRNNHDTV